MSGAQPELLAQGSVEIRRPLHETFAYVSNMENFPAWFPGVAAMRELDTLEHGQVGKRYRETVHMPFGRTGTIDIEVKEARVGERLLTEGEGFLLPRMSVDFAALSDDSTRVEWRMVSRNQRWWFRWLVVPLLRRVMRGRARDGLRELRENLEREPS
ncbi:SRPBCC family protein [Sorangium sp. So ce1153]|uniref:SRPBCC family protein n=1 Tax=Sorangium sp. So ce1153 TaxID=3133333 RepID=UPI003F63741E